eukprot:4251349-Lingulodinium_polyedra.AAC.1
MQRGGGPASGWKALAAKRAIVATMPLSARSRASNTVASSTYLPNAEEILRRTAAPQARWRPTA